MHAEEIQCRSPARVVLCVLVFRLAAWTAGVCVRVRWCVRACVPIYVSLQSQQHVFMSLIFFCPPLHLLSSHTVETCNTERTPACTHTDTQTHACRCIRSQKHSPPQSMSLQRQHLRLLIVSHYGNHKTVFSVSDRPSSFSDGQMTAACCCFAVCVASFSRAGSRGH